VQYFREIGQSTLLTAEEERGLAAEIERAAMEPEKGTMPDPQIMASAERARTQLIQSNLRLVVSIAKKDEKPGLPLADLIEEGNIGLMRAVRGFDHHLGYRFSTYAAWWIRQAISKAVQETYTVHIPADVISLVTRIRRARGRLMQELGRYPSAEEVG